MELDPYRSEEIELEPGVLKLVTYYENLLFDELILVNGLQQDYNGQPAYIKNYYPVGINNNPIPEIKLYFTNDILTKKIDFHENGKKYKEEKYCPNGIALHSEDIRVPSRIVYRQNESVYSKEWHEFGVLVRKEIYATKNQTIIGLFEYQNGELKKSTSYYGKRITTLIGNTINTRIVDTSDFTFADNFGKTKPIPSQNPESLQNPGSRQNPKPLQRTNAPRASKSSELNWKSDMVRSKKSYDSLDDGWLKIDDLELEDLKLDDEQLNLFDLEKAYSDIA